MSTTDAELACPHCGAHLKAFHVPDGLSWEEVCHWACFNDDCSYFVGGWEWMREHYNMQASYRYRIVSPQSTKCMPLAVPSRLALLDQIAED